MNTLKTIQSLAKIGKIFSKIIFVCCIVGFCGCIVGIVSLAIGAETLKLGGVTLHSMITMIGWRNAKRRFAEPLRGSANRRCRFAQSSL